MKTIRLSQRTGRDGSLSLNIPLGEPDRECEIVIVLPSRDGDAPAWPPGFLDATYGSIDDPSFERPPQGGLPDAVGWD